MTVTILVPILRLFPRRFLQLERVAHRNGLQLIHQGLASRNYKKTVRNYLHDSIKTFGTCSVGVKDDRDPSECDPELQPGVEREDCCSTSSRRRMEHRKT